MIYLHISRLHMKHKIYCGKHKLNFKIKKQKQ